MANAAIFVVVAQRTINVRIFEVGEKTSKDSNDYAKVKEDEARKALDEAEALLKK